MIELNHISKIFYPKKYKSQGYKSLDDINLEILPGQIVGLIGLNGAGKTTLLKLIAGLYKPTYGEISIKVSYVKDYRVSMLSSEQGLYNHLSVKQLVDYFGTLQNKDFSYQDNDTKILIDYLKIESVFDKQISTLSSGWRQKVLILLSFINNPDIILLDEPSNYLDFQGQKQLNTLIIEAKKRNKYIVYASHNLFEIERIADSIIFIHQGRVIFYKDKAKLYQEEKINNPETTLIDIIKRQVPDV
ncbi:MAG: ABC transporter ATP-binding protein [Candidatus Cloacimonetes bacterium]|jgi:sodium transport system ATP-binding protein|nr:ABC transporter ATP-binding protein [Candidatus Cloacimonadota bacterium]MDD4155980.1 ABC transporter ATP-binding protein [Candidatus Cloacimonadota bacterium]